MPAEYAAASFVVMPSLYESFGLVTAEALPPPALFLDLPSASAPPSLSPMEVNGILLPRSGDRIGQLADGMTRLMSDPALRDRLAPMDRHRRALRRAADRGWLGKAFAYRRPQPFAGCRAKQRGSRT